MPLLVDAPCSLMPLLVDAPCVCCYMLSLLNTPLCLLLVPELVLRALLPPMACSTPSTTTGKGMHSRLYTRVLNRHSWVHTCSAVNSLYNTTGLVGIFASGESSHAEQLVNVIIEEMQVRGKSG